MLYLSVLALEFAPSIFERLHWPKLQELWAPAGAAVCRRAS